MTRRALITGVTGFIGGELARRLIADGWQVHAIVRPQSDTHDLALTGDITLHVVEDGQDLTSLLAATTPDVVFHLASLYLADHRADQIGALIQSNLLFTALLAEAMAATGTRNLINTGTAWQHFRTDGYRPVNLYAATKQAAEDLLLYYVDARDLSLITLRLFDTYGPGDKRRKLIQILIDAARTGEPLDMSPGDQIVDMTHVYDVVSGFVLAADQLMTAEARQARAYILSGERHSVKALAQLVSDALDRPVKARFGERAYRTREVMEPIVPGPDAKLPGWTRTWSLPSYLAAFLA